MPVGVNSALAGAGDKSRMCTFAESHGGGTGALNRLCILGQGDALLAFQAVAHGASSKRREQQKQEFVSVQPNPTGRLRRAKVVSKTFFKYLLVTHPRKF
jgi:hypothetical protein